MKNEETTNKQVDIDLITNKSELGHIFRKFGEFTEMGTISFGKNEIIVEETNPSMTTYIRTVIKKECFEKYKVKNPCKIGVNFEDLGRVMNWILGEGYSKNVNIKSDGKRILLQQIEKGKLTGTEYQLPVFETNEKDMDYEEIVNGLKGKMTISSKIEYQMTSEKV